MSNLPIRTRVWLSVINGVITGGIAAWFYATFAGRDGELWTAIHFHPLNYLAMILICCVNTFGYFALIKSSLPIVHMKGFFTGGLVATAGSFLCSLVMGIGTGKIGDLLFGTAFFIPISGTVGSIAGLVLAYIVRRMDQRA